jgi:superfamily II DNA/RNA helicase
VGTPANELANATHQFHAMSREDRASRCAELVTQAGPTVVFVRTKHGADRLAQQLERAGVPAAAIHGDRSQAQRDRALAAFRSGKAWALVATDVAARGIHVDGVACVIHYDLPPDPKDYVHRSGRTARNGAEGLVISLVTPDERGSARLLARHLAMPIEMVGDHGPAPTAAGPRPSRHARATGGHPSRRPSSAGRPATRRGR